MSSLTIEEVATFTLTWRAIMDRVDFIAEQRGYGEQSYGVDFSDLGSKDPRLVVRWTTYHCGDSDQHDDTITISELLAPDADHIEARRLRIEREEVARKEEYRIAAERAAAARRSHDLRTLRELRAKYPDET